MCIIKDDPSRNINDDMRKHCLQAGNNKHGFAHNN